MNLCFRIGFAIAKKLAEDGADVVISSRKQKNVDKAVNALKALNLSVTGLICHVGKLEDRQRLLKTVSWSNLQIYGLCFLPFALVRGRNEVVAKVIFLHLSVILFTGGVYLNACWDTNSPGSRPPGPDTPQEQTPPLEQTPHRADPPGVDTNQADTPQEETSPEQTPPSRHPPRRPPQSRHPPGADPPGADTPRPGSRLQHTVYERPVRILLECILV